MIRRLLALVLVLTLASRTVAAQAVDSIALGEARESFHRGVSALREGRNVEAIASLERSLALRDLPVVRYNLALAYRAAGRNAAAIAEFERYLSSGDASATPERTQAVRQEIAQLRASLAAERATARTPARARSASRSAVVAPSDPTSPLPTILIASGLGVAAISLTINVALLASGSAVASAEQARCGSSNSPPCRARAMTARTEVDSRVGAITGVWVVGGLGLAAAGVGVGLLVANRHAREGAVRVSHVSPTLGGVAVSGTF